MFPVKLFLDAILNVHTYLDFAKAQQVNGVYAEQSRNVTQNESTAAGGQQQDPTQDTLGMLCGPVQQSCANQANEPSRTMEESSPLNTRENLAQQVISESPGIF